jgi:hypothetical protein
MLTSSDFIFSFFAEEHSMLGIPSTRVNSTALAAFRELEMGWANRTTQYFSTSMSGQKQGIIQTSKNGLGEDCERRLWLDACIRAGKEGQ